LIPRMQALTADHYPGTKTAITEYNWGGLEHINGALSQAEILGIFGREGLDLATLWDPPGFDEPGAFAFRMYRNYDGQGATFGDTSVGAASDDQDVVSVYAALTADDTLTVMLVNKTADELTSELTLDHFVPSGPAEVYHYSEADLDQITRGEELSASDGGISVPLEGASVTLLVIPGTSIDPRGDRM